MKLLPALILMLIALETPAQPSTQSYEQMKITAELLEESLSKEELSKLNLSYSSPLTEAFRYCVELSQPQSFEIISLVNSKGKIVQTWPANQEPFARCMADQFKGKTLYPVQKQSFYSIFNFTLSE